MEQCVRTKRRKIAAKVAEHFRVVSEQINQQALDFDYGEPLEDVFEDSVENVLQNTENECATDIFYDALDFKSFNDFENDYADTDLDCSDSEDEIENASEIQLDDADGLADMMPFAIVDFLDGGGVAVVPCKWFTGPEEDACYWPPGRVNISKAVKEEVVPNSDWPQFKVRILGKAGNYAHATSKLRKSEVTSDLQTESDSGGNLGKGKRKKRAMILSSSDEDSDGAGHDRPPSSVPLLPPVPEICQPEAPQVAVVADIGGSTVDEATRRMMTFLLDHSLSREYNFVGRHGKREFRGLRLFEVMYENGVKDLRIDRAIGVCKKAVSAFSYSWKKGAG
ncbi:coiled-coil domain-containing 8-like protein [Labeo rohita]|uniref:Coiled-coil domain-containing 8-like protein n=1 Tax=Labeo rohita TaxID=84645 RepID=A0A498M7G8_LABRO|nr:coiled-coil domain-containing 8-like protein [Labeo rohita]